MTVAQPARIWLSPAGAVSPLHYDASSSFLVQVLSQLPTHVLPPTCIAKDGPPGGAGACSSTGYWVFKGGWLGV